MFLGKLDPRVCKRCDVIYNPTGGGQRFCKDCGIINEQKVSRLYNHKPDVIVKRKLYDRSEKAKVKYRKYRTTEKYRLYIKRRTLNQPIKYKAQYSLSNAVRDGRLIRPDACESCDILDWGKNRSMIEGHHYKGYSEENWLKIKWLCTNCHKLAHKFIKEVVLTDNQ